jgi:hypothetical protein
MRSLADLINWHIGSDLPTRHKRPMKATGITGLKKPPLTIIAALILLPPFVAAPASAEAEANSDGSDAIIGQYLQATETKQDVLRDVSMQVQIDATLPKLKEHGRLFALRKISKVGQITYHVLGFQGANTVKREVIARYLQAEQQGQRSSQNVGITPVNYKFKYKGERALNKDMSAYIFQLCPRKKQIGLFKGEMWLDSHTYLPIYEKGRLIKNPSVFFKKVDFQRTYAIQNGVAIPQYMTSTIDTRLVGKIHLSVSYSNFSQGAEASNTADGEPDAEAISSVSSR